MGGAAGGKKIRGTYLKRFANSLGVLHVILPEKKLLCTTRYTLIRAELVFNSDHPALFQQAQHVVSIKWADPQQFSQDRIVKGRIVLQVITRQGILKSERTLPKEVAVQGSLWKVRMTMTQQKSLDYLLSKLDFETLDKYNLMEIDDNI